MDIFFPDIFMAVRKLAKGICVGITPFSAASPGTLSPCGDY